MTWMAMTKSKMEQHEQAIEMMKTALINGEAEYDKKSVNYCYLLNKIGQMYTANNQYEQSLTIFT